MREHLQSLDLVICPLCKVRGPLRVSVNSHVSLADFQATELTRLPQVFMKEKPNLTKHENK